MPVVGLDRFSTAVNVFTVADLGLRFGSQVVRNVAPVRQVVFSDAESRQLMDMIAQSIKKSEKLLSQDNGLEPAEIKACRTRLAGYDLSLSDEESLLDSINDSRIMHFRRTVNLGTDFDREEQRKRLVLLSGCTARFYVEVLSKSRTARTKHEAALKCGKFEDEDDIPAMSSTSAFNDLKSWLRAKFSLEPVLPDIEATETTGTPRSDGGVIIPHQGPHELNVDVIDADNQMFESSDGAVAPCRLTVTFECPGVNYVIRDPRIKTLADVKSLCSPQSMAAICSVGMGLANRTALPRGSYGLPYNPLSGTYDILEETTTDGEVD